MCSRTQPFATLSSIKGRRPIRASFQDSQDFSDDDNQDSQQSQASRQRSPSSQSVLTENNNCMMNSPDRGDPRQSHSNGPSAHVTNDLSPGRQSSTSPASSPRLDRRENGNGINDSSHYGSKNSESDDSDDKDDDSETEIDVEGVIRSSQKLLYPNLDEIRGGDVNGDDEVVGSSSRSSAESPGRKDSRSPRGRNTANGKPLSASASKTTTTTTTTTPSIRRDSCEIRNRAHVHQPSSHVIGYNGERTSSSTNSEGKTTSSDDSSRWSILYVSLLIVGIVVGIYFVKNKSEIPTRELMERGDISKIYDGLKASFPSQTKRSWAFFNGPLRRVLRDKSDSEEPAVLLLAGEPSTVRCLVKKAASQLHFVALPSSVEPLVLEGSLLQKKDVFVAKCSMDESIRRHLGEDAGGKIVVIHDLDLIPAEATLLLHGFSDHENSPFKRAFFFLTISREYTLSQKASEEDQRAEERRVGNDLDAGLSATLGLDATKALMARIANSIVVVAPEADGGNCQ